MAVNFIDPVTQLVGRQTAKVVELPRLDSFFGAPGKRIGMGFNQPYQPVGKHHNHLLLAGSACGQPSRPSLQAPVTQAPLTQAPSVTADSAAQPSTGILEVSTLGSSVCGTVMAREIRHTALVLRSNPMPASNSSSEWTVSLGRIVISQKLHPTLLRRTLPSTSTSRSV